MWRVRSAVEQAEWRKAQIKRAEATYCPELGGYAADSRREVGGRSRGVMEGKLAEVAPETTSPDA